MINKKNKQKNYSVFEIFRRSEDPSYPEMLVKFLESSNAIDFQFEKAQYLMNIWANEYHEMPQIRKSSYYNVIPKVLKLLYSVYLKKKKGIESISTLYFLNYKKWTEITTHIQKGLKQSNHDSLILLWSISFKMIKHISLIQRQQYGQFLAEHFQDSLSQYHWSCHNEKVYILQILKYINNDIQYKPFITNAEKWTSIIKAIKDQEFKSEVVKNKGQMHLEVFKYQYEQIRVNKEKIVMATSTSQLKKKIKLERKKTIVGSVGGTSQEQQKKQKQKQKQRQKQYLSRQQIHMFLVVKDQQQQKQIYRIELLNEIISCRPLMSIICQQYWESLTYQVISEIEKKIETLNIQVRTDLLLSRMFLGLLKYRKTAHIIREKIGQDIVVKLIKNIELFKKRSPFQTPQFLQIPTLVNEAFFYITPEMAAQKITVESIINKRVRSIIQQGNMGKDDIISRSLMTVSCREELMLKLLVMREIQQFLITIKKKKSVKIETVIILVKILITAHKSPQFPQLNLLNLATCLTFISQLFSTNQKVNQLRKLCIKLLIHLIPFITANQEFTQTDYGMLIDETLKWFLIVELNFSFVFAPMINVLILFISRYQEYFLAQERAMEHFEKILSGLMEKLGHEHNSENMFAFLDCLLKAYVKFQWSTAQIIFLQIPEASFVDWEILYQKQARILFKKEQQKKLLQKIEAQKQKKKRQQKWSSLMKRKQSLTATSSSKKLTHSQLQPQSQNQQTRSSTFYIDYAQQKKFQQRMQIFFGSAQKAWLRQLINNYQLWNRDVFIKSELACLEYSLIQTIFTAEKQYYIMAQRPNEFMKRIVGELDGEIYELFSYLIDSEAYQLLFLFASQIFFVCRDFFFVSKLRSYQLLLNKCFQILSVFFNKVQILYACSTFCSLLLPYANHSQLRQVYNQLNKQQFLTDLFKGSNQFIGKQKCYYTWLIKILMGFQITQQFRQKQPLIREALQTLSKNVLWWSNVEYLINGEIDADDHEVKESKILIFEIFKEQYKKLVDGYFSLLQKVIEVGVKGRQIGAK